MRAGTLDLAGVAAGLTFLLTGVSVLSHSHLIHGENAPRPARPFRSDPVNLAEGPVADLCAGQQRGSGSAGIRTAEVGIRMPTVPLCRERNNVIFTSASSPAHWLAPG
jgi:hypothetical protein